MTDILGCSIRLFLVDGNPNGLITAEIINWSGRILTGSRLEITDLLQREELQQTGVYFLFGYNPEGDGEPIIYIGESENVRTRLAQHIKDDKKDFWKKTCVVTSKDQNITKAHARYLEARLINIATEVGRTKLVNRTAQNPQKLPESDTSDMEYFIDQIRLVLPILGFDAFKATPKRNPLPQGSGATTNDQVQSPVFEILHDAKNIRAKGQEIEGEFVVFKDSSAVAEWIGGASKTSGYAKLKKELKKTKKLTRENNSNISKFSEDVAFSSPSAAASIVLGRSANGRTEWKLEGSDKTYKNWQEEIIERIAMAQK